MVAIAEVEPKPRKRKAQMKRSDWYAVYMLSIMSVCLIWDGRRTAGLVVLLLSVVILVTVDGFGIELGD